MSAQVTLVTVGRTAALLNRVKGLAAANPIAAGAVAGLATVVVVSGSWYAAKKMFGEDESVERRSKDRQRRKAEKAAETATAAADVAETAAEEAIDAATVASKAAQDAKSAAK